VGHIFALRDGAIVYGAHDPAWGVIDAGGARVLFQGRATADYRNTVPVLLLSPDAAAVQFSYEENGRASARFSVAERKLAAANRESTNWRAPETVDSNLRITDWLDSEKPMFNGYALRILHYEISTSLALAPDRENFLLGTGWNLRYFRKESSERWMLAAPADVRAVNISADGRLGVASLADGTIRWYNLAEAKEILAFFPHADRKRWVLWTPSGYYDAAPGAEDLIGWHVNNGLDTAPDFLRGGKFRATYYRPDVIDRILATGNETRALQLADEEAARK
jgi:WD40 repeat protein